MRFLLLSAVLLVLLTGPARAAKWDVVPALTVQETYSDNIALAPEGSAQTEWVTQVIPAIKITATGTGLRFSADYAPQLTFYARGQQEDQVFQRLNATGTAELADDLLFIDAGVSADQFDVSLQGALPDNNVNLTTNRATVGTFYASPYLDHYFGSSARVQARYTYSVWNSSDQAAFNNTANNVNLDLSSGPAYRVFTWDLAYTNASIDYDTAPDLGAEIILATARRLITPTVGLLAQVGNENYEEVISGAPTGVSDGGARWGLGVDWLPSDRTHVTAAFGSRFFGNAYLLDLNHRTRRMTLRASYNQDITTTRTEFFATRSNGTAGYLDPLYCTKDADPEACKQEAGSVVSERGLPVSVSGPVNFFSNVPFLQERVQASVAMQGVRNTIIVTVFNEYREVLPGFAVQTGGSTGNGSVYQTGVNLVWNFPMTARTFWNLDTRYERNRFPDSVREDNITTLGMGLTRQFQGRLSGSLEYRGQQRDSTDSAASYAENSVWATLNMGF